MKKIRSKSSLLALLVLTFVMAIVTPMNTLAAQPTVNQGTTEDFAVLAGSTITNTGETTINGDVGLDPGTGFTGQDTAKINGKVNINNEDAKQAKDDLITAYDDAAGNTEVTEINTELGGQTLTPGVYKSPSGTFENTGTLTLDSEGDPDGTFIFQMGTTLTTGSDSKVELKNDARSCKVFWQVGSSATLGANSNFKGSIFAKESITANNEATVEGQLLATDGAVTLDNNTITNKPCAEEPVEDVAPVITVIGDNPMELEVGEDYVELGATAEDDVDGNITDAIVTSGEVDTSEEGTYEVDYTVSDSAGNETTETRVVNVVQAGDLPATTSVDVEKVWELHEGEAQEVEINLLADGEKVGSVKLNADNEWEHTFTDLPTVNDVTDEEAIEYTIEEVEIDGFESKVTGDQKDGFTVTNTEIVDQTPIEPANTSVDVEKVWELDEGEAQEVEINLLADGKKVESVKLNADNEWKYTFTDLPTVNDVTDEEAIEYTIEEVEIDGFESKVTGDQKEGYTVTNTEEVPQTPVEPGNTSVDVEKVWELHEGEAQEVEINLLADGEKVKSVKLNADNEWKHTFTDLPTVNDVTDEEAIEYTIEEVEIDGFESKVTGDQKDGFTVTNKEIVDQTPIEPATTSVDVEKVWKGEGLESVKINLLADGEKVRDVLLSNDNEWEHTFTDLPTVNDVTDDKAIEYTIEELEIEGYESEVTGNQKEGYTVTNTEEVPQTPVEPGNTSVDVEKVWELHEGEAQEVEINLLADGEKVESVKLNADNEWEHTFTDLPTVNDITDKEVIKYTVEEVEIDGFESKVTGDQKGGYTVTNTEEVPQTPVEPGNTSVDVNKAWIGEAQDTVTINLLADGEKIDTVELSKDNDWKHTFTELPNMTKDLEPIVYTIEEVDVEGYETSIAGNAQNGFTVTNTEIIEQTPIEPGKTSVDVEKVWIGAAQDTVIINLLADGEKIDTVELSKDNDWKHTFTELPNMTKDLEPIVYTIEEVDVEGYETSIAGNAQNGFTVTNTEISEEPVVPEPEEPETEEPVVPEPEKPETEEPVVPKPGKPEIEEPVAPEEESTTTEDDEDSTVSVDDEDSTTSKGDVEGGKLPSTATDIFKYLLIGLGLILFGGLSYFVFRKKSVEK